MFHPCPKLWDAFPSYLHCICQVPIGGRKVHLHRVVQWPLSVAAALSGSDENRLLKTIQNSPVTLSSPSSNLFLLRMCMMDILSIYLSIDLSIYLSIDRSNNLTALCLCIFPVTLTWHILGVWPVFSGVKAVIERPKMLTALGWATFDCSFRASSRVAQRLNDWMCWQRLPLCRPLRSLPVFRYFCSGHESKLDEMSRDSQRLHATDGSKRAIESRRRNTDAARSLCGICWHRLAAQERPKNARYEFSKLGYDDFWSRDVVSYRHKWYNWYNLFQMRNHDESCLIHTSSVGGGHSCCASLPLWLGVWISGSLESACPCLSVRANSFFWQACCLLPFDAFCTLWNVQEQM